MANRLRVYKGDSPNRVERGPNYRPQAEPKPFAHGGSLSFKPLNPDGEPGYPVGEEGYIDPEKFAEHMAAIFANPMRYAQVLVDTRRPGKVSKSAHQIAMRKAGRQPMLNADPAQTRRALEGRTFLRKNARLDKMPPFKRIVVKPTSAITGVHGWYERLWSIHNLKYSRGVVAVTHDGDETKIFPQYSELRSAIVKSGWQIIREEVPKGGNKR